MIGRGIRRVDTQIGPGSSLVPIKFVEADSTTKGREVNPMKVSKGACLTSVAGLVATAGMAVGQCNPLPPVGPDVIVGDMHGSVQNYTPQTTGFDADHDSLSFGTTSCNIGNARLMWFNDGDVGTHGPDIANKHPVIGQTLYRFSRVDGASRFEMLGTSWLKHGFLALAQSACCPCQNPGDGNYLGIGCSDPYSASRNGGQSGAGPRYQVNANNGEYIYPLSGLTASSGQTGRRLRVKLNDLVTTTGGPAATTRYFGETQYVTPDDATARRGNNNASIKEVSVSGPTNNRTFNYVNISNNPYNNTNRMKSAIRVWRELDPEVTETEIQLPNEGFFILSSRATRLPNGNFRYEYSLYNMNSDRSARSLTLPMLDSIQAENMEFRDFDYHSGDGLGNVNWDGTDWVSKKENGAISWATDTYQAKPNANAIRWSSTYSFRFDTVMAPSFVDTFANVGIFKPPMPGEPASVNALAVAPGEPGSIVELLGFLNVWTSNLGSAANNTDARRADLDENNAVDLLDLLAYLSAWQS